MKIKICFLVLFIGSLFSGIAQTPEELYEKRDYKALMALEKKSNELKAEELYFVGYAFFQQENDKKAIKMYDKAIEKGLDEDYIYLYKGLALRYDKQYQKAIETFRIAIQKDPKRQKNWTELGNAFYLQSQFDSARANFEMARALPYELGDPYIKIPLSYHIEADYKKALNEYYISLAMVDKTTKVYSDILMNIGLLEYTTTHNYFKSILAYSQLIELNPDKYDYYPKLIKAYYGAEEFDKADSLFQILKKAYKKELLPEDYQKYGNVDIAEFEWNGQTVVVYRQFKEPKELLDIMYRIYLLDKEGKKIERKLMTEQTMKLDAKSPKHLLCERGLDGTHYTYLVGWPTDNIPYLSLKEEVLKILDGKSSPGASSRASGSVKSKKKDKRKRKNKN